MSDTPKLGNKIQGVADRDAVHVAVIPVIAGYRLSPGEHVGVISTSQQDIVVGISKDPIGIIDPFLQTAVQADERCYLCMYPGTTHSLKHHWSHPAFDDVVSDQYIISREWITAFAEEADGSYEELMEAAAQWIKCGKLSYNLPYSEIGPDHEFWDHYGVVVGADVPVRLRDHFLACSC